MGKTLPILQRKEETEVGGGERESVHVLLSMCLVKLGRNA